MAIVSKVTLKTYFETGDKPTEGQFEDLIDSLAHVTDVGGGGGGGADIRLGFVTTNAAAFVWYSGDDPPTFTEDAAGEYTLTEIAGTLIKKIQFIGNEDSLSGSGGLLIHIVSEDGNDHTVNTAIIDRDSGQELKNYAAPGITVTQDISGGTNDYALTSMDIYGVAGFKLNLQIA